MILAPASTSFRWSHLALLSAAVMLTVSLETLPAGILPAMSEEFGRSTTSIGILVSVWGFTVIATSIPLVRLVARWDRRIVTAACLAITGALGLATAAAPTYGVALASRLLGGASHGVFWALVVVYAAALAPPRFLAAGIALVTGGSQLAAAVVIPTAATLVEHMSWRWIYAGLSGLAIVIAIAVRAVLPSNLPAAPSPGEKRPLPWRDPRLVGPFALAAVALFFVFAHFAVYTYTTVLFSGPRGPDPHLSIYLAVIGAASILGLIISGPLANRWPRRGVAVYLALFAAAMLLILPSSSTLRFTGLAVWGLMFGVIGPAAQSLALRFTPEEQRPTISATMVVTFNLGISLGSLSGGLVADATGVWANPIMAAVALVGAAGLAWWAGGRLQEESHKIPT